MPKISTPAAWPSVLTSTDSFTLPMIYRGRSEVSRGRDEIFYEEDLTILQADYIIVIEKGKKWRLSDTPPLQN